MGEALALGVNVLKTGASVDIGVISARYPGVEMAGWMADGVCVIIEESFFLHVGANSLGARF